MAEATMSTRRKTAMAFIEAYNSWNLDAIMAVRAEDCIHQIAPASLNREGMPNAIYGAFFGVIMPRITNFKVTVKELVEDAAANKIVVWCSSTADTAAGVGTYGNEYMLLFYFNEEGDKLKKIVEFVDSAKTKEQKAVLTGQ